MHLHQLNDSGAQGDSLKNNTLDTLLTTYHPCVRSAQEKEPNTNYSCQVKPDFCVFIGRAGIGNVIYGLNMKNN